MNVASLAGFRLFLLLPFLGFGSTLFGSAFGRQKRFLQNRVQVKTPRRLFRVTHGGGGGGGGGGGFEERVAQRRS